MDKKTLVWAVGIIIVVLVIGWTLTINVINSQKEEEFHNKLRESAKQKTITNQPVEIILTGSISDTYYCGQKRCLKINSYEQGTVELILFDDLDPYVVDKFDDEVSVTVVIKDGEYYAKKISVLGGIG